MLVVIDTCRKYEKNSPGNLDELTIAKNVIKIKVKYERKKIIAEYLFF